MITNPTEVSVIIGPFASRSYADGLIRLLSDLKLAAVVKLEDLDEVQQLLIDRSAADAGAGEAVVILDAKSCIGTSYDLDDLPSSTVILLDSDGPHAAINVDNPSGERFVQIVQALVEGTGQSPGRPGPAGFEGFDRPEASHTIQPVEEWLRLVLGLALTRLKAEQAGRSISGWYVSPDNALAELKLEAAGGHPQATDDLTDLAARLDVVDQALIVDRGTLPVPVSTVAAGFQLDDLELRVLLLALAPEIDGRYGLAFGVLNDDLTRRRPTLTVLRRLVDGRSSAWSLRSVLFRPNSAFASGLLESRSPSSSQAAVDDGIRLNDVVPHYLLGGGRAAAKAFGARLHPPAPHRLTDRERQVAERLRAIVDNMGGPAGPVLNPTGAEIGWFQRAVTGTGIPLLIGNVSTVDGAALEGRLSHWGVLATLHGAGLLIVGVEVLSAQDRSRLATELVAMRDRLPLVAVTGDEILTAGTGLPILRLRPPHTTALERTQLWATAAENAGVHLGPEDCRHLAVTVPITPDDMDLCFAVTADSPGDGEAAPHRPIRQRLQDAARHLDRTPLPPAVQRIETEFGWNDIVLPPAVMASLRTVTAHMAHAGQVMEEWGFEDRVPYGKGLAALFSGPSGTGKTMAARIIAGELGVELLQVDLAKTVSKYIGETEKNLDAAFLAAERMGAVLLFDEADALFGKRTEVKDSHDRHANVEVAYLLQRIEALNGLAILTTNLKQNIDNAFLRRLRFSVDFPLPNVRERETIWRRSFPGAAPLADDLDLSFLARRLKLTGGNIQQIAIHAAFSAAADGCAIGPEHVISAARQELLKVGMLNTEKALEGVAA